MAELFWLIVAAILAARAIETIVGWALVVVLASVFGETEPHDREWDFKTEREE